jgi:acyl-CoA thioester hydrolase
VEGSARMAEVFERQVTVRWRDSDGLGHVNHAVFLTYLEEGRDAFYDHAFSDTVYVVARIEIDLRHEVLVQDRRVTVQIVPERLGTSSLTTRETVLTAGGEVAAEARVVTVRWDADKHRSAPFTEAERARIAAIAGEPSLGTAT